MADKPEQFDEDEALSIQDAITEAERLLVGRRTTIATYRPSVKTRIPTSRPHSLLHRRRSSASSFHQRRLSALDIDYEDFKHLLLLDHELERDVEHRRFSLLSLPQEERKLEEKLDEERCKAVLRRMRSLTCIAALGGFLSGYNTGVISGALLPLKRVFYLSPEQEESIVSSTIMFAFVASLLGGIINQRIGRRKTILGAAAIFSIGSIILFGAQNYAMLIAGEVILGIGIGIESLTSPLYIAEVAKPSIRGMLVSAYALMMCFGQFFAGIVDGIAANFAGGWRCMFGMAFVPGMTMFVGFLGLPESPTWLLAAGRHAEGEAILKTVRDTDHEVQHECLEIKETMAATMEGSGSDSGVASIFHCKSTCRALLVGCSLMVPQQCCGANVVMYYSATIYRMSGFSEETSIWLSAFTALAQLLGLALSVSLVEKAGRRPLVLCSLSGVAICLAGLGGSFYLARILSENVMEELSDNECFNQPSLVWDGVTRYSYDCTLIKGCGFCRGACVVGTSNGPMDDYACPNRSEWEYDVSQTPLWVALMPLFFMVAYLIVFGVGVAGLPWTINSEIYPVKHRSAAVAISTSTNWLCNLLVSSTFLTISDPAVLTIYGSFWLYSLVSVAGVCWLYVMLPETKGLSLEEIEEAFGRDHAIKGERHFYRAISEEERALSMVEQGKYGST